MANISDAKMELVKDKVQATYAATKNVEACYGACVGVEGVRFTEIKGIVDFTLEKLGLVVALAKRKENFKEGINIDPVSVTTYSDMMKVSAIYADQHQTGDTWSLIEVKKWLKDNAISVPVKISVTPWKMSLLASFQKGITDFETIQLNMVGEGLFADIGKVPVKALGFYHFALEVYKAGQRA